MLIRSLCLRFSCDYDRACHRLKPIERRLGNVGSLRKAAHLEAALPVGHCCPDPLRIPAPRSSNNTPDNASVRHLGSSQGLYSTRPRTDRTTKASSKWTPMCSVGEIVNPFNGLDSNRFWAVMGIAAAKKTKMLASVRIVWESMSWRFLVRVIVALSRMPHPLECKWGAVRIPTDKSIEIA